MAFDSFLSRQSEPRGSFSPESRPSNRLGAMVRSLGVSLCLVLAAAAALWVIGGNTSGASASSHDATVLCVRGTAVASPSSNPGLVKDCAILLAAKDTLRGTETLNWSADTAITNWEGITVSGTPSRVTRLELDRNTSGPLYGRRITLTGTIPATLGGLSKLERLKLSRHQLTGTIPAELANLSELTSLQLYGNDLTGGIPPELGSLSNLTNLALGTNPLGGGIPVELEKLSNLRSLRLANSQLTGSIPASLGALSNLYQLELYGNTILTGCIPASLRGITLSDLRHLDLEYCTTTTTYSLTTSTGGNGRVSPLPGTYSYLSGASVTVTATPDEGYHIVSWGGDCSASGTATTCTLTMDAAKSASVTFEGATPLTTYTLTISAAGSGLTVPLPYTYSYHSGAVVRLVAIPDSGYRVGWWGGDCSASGTDTTCTLTMDANKTVSVAFEEGTAFTLTTSAGANGSTDPTPGAHSYDEDASVTVTARPATGYRVASWSGDCTGSGATCTLTMDADKSAAVTFEQATAYTLTTSAGANGSIDPASGTHTYYEDTSVTVTATSDSNYRVASWGGDCSGMASTCVLAMDGNKTASVTFERVTYTLTSSATGGGTLNTTGTTTQDAGTDVTLTASWNDATHSFTGWGGDCSGTLSTCVLTMDAPKSATATFAALLATRCATPTDASCIRAVYLGAPGDYAQITDIPATLLLTPGSDGRYRVERGYQYTVVTAAQLPEGYTRFYLQQTPLEFGTPSPVSASQLIPPVGTTYTFTPTADPEGASLITFDLTAGRPHPVRPTHKPELGDVVVTTVFEVQRHTLTTSAGTNGGIDPAPGTHAYDTNTSVTVTATPDSGYRVVSWGGDCSASGTETTCVLTMDADKTASVTFEQGVVHTLTTSSGENGGIDPAPGTHTYHEDASVTLTALPNGGYRVASWSGACAASGTASTCVLTMDADKTAGVTFERDYAWSAQCPDGSASGGQGGYASESVAQTAAETWTTTNCADTTSTPSETRHSWTASCNDVTLSDSGRGHATAQDATDAANAWVADHCGIGGGTVNTATYTAWTWSATCHGGDPTTTGDATDYDSLATAETAADAWVDDNCPLATFLTNGFETVTISPALQRKALSSELTRLQGLKSAVTASGLAFLQPLISDIDARISEIQATLARRAPIAPILGEIATLSLGPEGISWSKFTYDGPRWIATKKDPVNLLFWNEADPTTVSYRMRNDTQYLWTDDYFFEGYVDPICKNRRAAQWVAMKHYDDIQWTWKSSREAFSSGSGGGGSLQPIGDNCWGVSIGLDGLSWEEREHLRFWSMNKKNDNYGYWTVGSAHYEVAQSPFYLGGIRDAHRVIGFEQGEQLVQNSFRRSDDGVPFYWVGSIDDYSFDNAFAGGDDREHDGVGWLIEIGGPASFPMFDDPPVTVSLREGDAVRKQLPIAEGDGQLSYSLENVRGHLIDIPGLQLDPHRSFLTGTARAGSAGDYVLRVRDLDGRTDTMAVFITVDLVPRFGPAVKSYEVTEGEYVNIPLPPANGGDRPLKGYSLSQTPPGLDLVHESLFDGLVRVPVLKGTVEPSVGLRFHLIATDANDDTVRLAINYVVDLVPKFPLTSRTYNWDQGEDASATLPTASGGDQPLMYTLSSTPPGLTFTEGTLLLAGTVEEGTTGSYELTVMDADGDTDVFGVIINVTLPGTYTLRSRQVSGTVWHWSARCTSNSLTGSGSGQATSTSAYLIAGWWGDVNCGSPGAVTATQGSETTTTWSWTADCYLGADGSGSGYTTYAAAAADAYAWQCEAPPGEPSEPALTSITTDSDVETFWSWSASCTIGTGASSGTASTSTAAYDAGWGWVNSSCSATYSVSISSFTASATQHSWTAECNTGDETGSGPWTYTSSGAAAAGARAWILEECN